MPAISPPSVTRSDPTLASTIVLTASRTEASPPIWRTSRCFPCRMSATVLIAADYIGGPLWTKLGGEGAAARDRCRVHDAAAEDRAAMMRQRPVERAAAEPDTHAIR